ncbi:MAG: hypothetical protein A2Y12_01665 [Planctomycetes bacterium GWF2_42_9]|nr:MAG: hypothetical protein A2Y12_01665 [Planctomycetes bacterium GWF2_42_9]HAL45680.1 hypothetical protein [Phycisphaerales bacterium]
MPSLTSIFGTEISVLPGFRQADREFTGFAGQHGLTEMLLGSRGADIVVRGRLRGTGANYAAARADAMAKLTAIEDANFLAADDYTFQSDTYYQVVWNKLEIIPNSAGQSFWFTTTSEVIVDFVCYGIMLQ